MKDERREAGRWLAQAENDFEFARHALDGDFHHQVCFIAQQCAEKALKAVLYAAGAKAVVGPAVAGLARRIAADRPEFAALEAAGSELDLFYIPSRYPNGLPEGSPFEAFTRPQAERALALAESILRAAQAALAEGRAGPGA